MTRQDREIALAVATAWLLLDEARDAAQGGTVAEAELVREATHIERALDHLAERLNIDAGDLLSAAKDSCLDVLAAGKAREWEAADFAAAEASRRASA